MATATSHDGRHFNATPNSAAPVPGRASALRAPHIAGWGSSSTRCSECRVALGRWRSRARGMLPSARAPERPSSRAPGLQASWESHCHDGRCIPESYTARRTPGGLSSGNYSASTYVGPSARGARRTIAGNRRGLLCCGCWPLQTCGLCGVCVRACAHACCLLRLDGWCWPDVVCGWELSITAPHKHFISHKHNKIPGEPQRPAESAPIRAPSGLPVSPALPAWALFCAAVCPVHES